MKVSDLCELISGKIIAGADGISTEVTGGYTGDLLSWIMSRAPGGSALITVMGNMNVIAVGMLAGLSCVVLAEGSVLDDIAKTKADSEGLAVVSCGLPAYEICLKLGGALS